MNIEMTFQKYRDKNSLRKMIYGVTIVVKNEDIIQSVFIDTGKMFDPDTVWIDINKFNDENFLKENEIEYILEGKDKNIIPIGLVNFTDPRVYYSNELNIWNRKEIELHKSNQIIKNIERAIQIKYEAVKFTNRFGNVDSFKVESINLD